VIYRQKPSPRSTGLLTTVNSARACARSHRRCTTHELRYLAWVNRAIRDLRYGMIEPEHLPPRLPEIAE